MCVCVEVSEYMCACSFSFPTIDSPYSIGTTTTMGMKPVKIMMLDLILACMHTWRRRGMEMMAATNALD